MKEGYVYKLVGGIGKGVVKIFAWLVELVDGKIVFANTNFIRGLAELEAGYAQVLSELNWILNNKQIPGIDEFFSEQERIAKNKSWKSFPLFVYGIEFMDNTSVCPNTKQLLLGIEGFSSAMFSILSANQEIPPHKGPYKGVLRVHLGLIVPPQEAGACYLIVDGEKRTWEMGRTVVFDDTHMHSSHNSSNMDRIVLFIDIIRPLPWPLNRINEILFNLISSSLFITDTVKKFEKFGNLESSKLKINFKV
jgi:ornithine lipid ester-linked acyl 2-hydroxylase